MVLPVLPKYESELLRCLNETTTGGIIFPDIADVAGQLFWRSLDVMFYPAIAPLQQMSPVLPSPSCCRGPSVKPRIFHSTGW